MPCSARSASSNPVKTLVTEPISKISSGDRADLGVDAHPAIPGDALPAALNVSDHQAGAPARAHGPRGQLSHHVRPDRTLHRQPNPRRLSVVHARLDHVAQGLRLLR